MDKQTLQTLARLDEQGKEQLNRGEWAQAVETFNQMLQLDDHPVVRNNLATAYYNGGYPEQAWLVLEPEIKKGVVSPFAWALASMIAQDLELPQRAREYLKKAISLFEAGVRTPQEFGFEPAAWREYTVVIKRAAGHLGEHRLIVDLHSRWEGFYETDEDYFQVGVAFFNLGFPLKAVQLWSRVGERGWAFLETYVAAAKLVNQGLVPRFTLPYAAPDLDSVAGLSREEFRDKLMNGGNRALVLAVLFTPGLPMAGVEEALSVLFSLDEWGREFGRRVLASQLPQEWKLAAKRALLEN